MSFGQALPGESKDAEDDGEDGEAADLDPFTADSIDSEDGEPVAGKCTGADEHNLSDGGVAEVGVEIFASIKAHC